MTLTSNGSTWRALICRRGSQQGVRPYPLAQRLSSEKIKRELDFVPKRTIEDAVHDLITAFRAGTIPNSMTDIGYYNIKTMQHLQLK